MDILALPPLDFLEEANGLAWVEMGAGSGLWMRIFHEARIDIIGFDIQPNGFGVLHGNQEKLQKYPHRALLIVWPPDGIRLEDWIDHYRGGTMAICGDFGRFYNPKTPEKNWCPDPEQWALRKEWFISGGRKGGSELKLYDRRQ